MREDNWTDWRGRQMGTIYLMFDVNTEADDCEDLRTNGERGLTFLPFLYGDAVSYADLSKG